MVTFLFWNINSQPLSESITKLVFEHDVDFLILAESDLPNVEFIKSLNSQGGAMFNVAPPGLLGPVKIYSRFPSQCVKPISDSGHIAIRHIVPPVGNDVLLVAVHLPSKLHQSEADQTLNCPLFVQTIEEAENKVGHTRTLVIGDLNMNPFENGIVGAACFHSVMDRRIASRGTRQVLGKDYRFFYNPMWSCFGDISPGPPGTYFYNTAKQVNLYWNIFDQVLIRPDLLDTFLEENLKVLTEVSSSTLLSESGRPDRRTGSDHLPILLRLKL